MSSRCSLLSSSLWVFSHDLDIFRFLSHSVLCGSHFSIPYSIHERDTTLTSPNLAMWFNTLRKQAIYSLLFLAIPSDKLNVNKIFGQYIIKTAEFLVSDARKAWHAHYCNYYCNYFLKFVLFMTKIPR